MKLETLNLALSGLGDLFVSRIPRALPWALLFRPLRGSLSRPVLPALLVLLLTFSAGAFPPALDHLFFGMVRDQLGNPLDNANAEIILESSAGVQVKGRIVPNWEPGSNYRLTIPMDAGLTSDLYKPTAMKPAVPFKIKVRIGSTIYLPIEMLGDYARLGLPGQRTRLDLTLGEDSDGDGLPDAWERQINSDLSKVRAGDDSDGDGISNLNEYLAGTYAFDPKNGFSLAITGFHDGNPVLEFLAIRGRTYTVQASRDLHDWSAVEFRIASGGSLAPAQSQYQAADVRPLQLEVPPVPGGEAPRFFRLMLQ